MSLISVFVDAVKRAFGRKPTIDIEDFRSSGGTLGSTPPTDAFDPLRPSQQTGANSDVKPSSIDVASADPEEGGEVFGPKGPLTTEGPPAAPPSP